MIFTLNWYIRNMSHQGKPWKKMTAFLSEWFVWPTAESITNILLPKISTIKPSKGSSIHHFRTKYFKLAIVLIGKCRKCTHQNLCLKIRIGKKNENGGWLGMPFLCHSCTPGGSSVMSVFIWRGCRSPMNFTTMASIKIPAITPKRNILLRVHVLLTKTTMTHVSFLITFLSYLNCQFLVMTKWL